MKRLLLIAALAVALCSCQSEPPKETARQFIKAVAANDFTTASSLTSADTKSVLDKAKKDVPPSSSPDESFQLSTLSETVNGDRAEVKNNILALSMVKEKEGWKVALNEKVLADIQGRDEMLGTAKAKWEELLKEYEARQKILRDYIGYKKSLGALSTQMQALEAAVEKTPAETGWTREKLLAYSQKQQNLNKVIDAALEPSQAANADLTLNYFLQISSAGDRIKAAESAYHAVAKKANSTTHVPLPMKGAGEATANKK